MKISGMINRIHLRDSWQPAVFVDDFPEFVIFSPDVTLRQEMSHITSFSGPNVLGFVSF